MAKGRSDPIPWSGWHSGLPCDLKEHLPAAEGMVFGSSLTLLGSGTRPWAPPRTEKYFLDTFRQEMLSTVFSGASLPLALGRGSARRRGRTKHFCPGFIGRFGGGLGARCRWTGSTSGRSSCNRSSSSPSCSPSSAGGAPCDRGPPARMAVRGPCWGRQGWAGTPETQWVAQSPTTPRCNF